MTNCYNTGDITGVKAVGIGSTRSNSFTNCYSTGNIEGTTYAYSINGSKYSDFTNSFYIEGRAAKDTSDYGTPISPDDMKKASFVTTLGEDAWKADAGAADNEGYPLLKWEKVSEVKQIKLGQPDSLAWDAPKEEKDGEAYATTFDHIKASWKAVDFAEKYVLKLYYQDEAEPVYTSEAVKDTELDLTDVFGQLEDKKTGNYYFTVQAIGDGKTYLDGDESAKDKRGFRLDAKAFIQAPDGLRWNQASKAAYWHTSKDADFYEVTLYRDKEKVKDFLITSEMLDKDSGQATIYFISSMTQPGTYNYTVRAGREYKDENGVSHRGYSKESASDDAKFSESEKKTIKINSVDDWMKIVNYTNKGTEYKTEAEAQNALWSNDFELTADLDFSNLTAEQQTQVKSWGNINAMFSGSFDGKGHKVTGLTLSNGDGGLFQYVGETGTVTNLKIEAPNVLFSDNAAVLCYYNYGTISRCSVVNPNVTADHGAIIGGFASRNFGTIEDSYVQGGSFSANSDTANGHAGFVGSNFGLIQRCWTSMNVKTKSFSAGGFCGWADEMGGKAGKFVDCFALGDVSAERGWCGGFVGRVNSKEVKFTNCYSASRVTSAQKPDKAFGFVGSMSGEAMADVIGYSSFNETIPESAFENCYYLTDNTEKENPKSPVTGVAGTEMKSSGFAEKLGAEWAQNASKNDGLPYLEGVQVPEKIQKSTISVAIAIALYDKEKYVFQPDGEVLRLTMETTGNTSVFQVMEEKSEETRASGLRIHGDSGLRKFLRVHQRSRFNGA